MPSPKPTPKPAPRPTSSEPSKGFRVALTLLKIVAIVWGFVATLISLMAVVGAMTENGYARLLIALAVTVIVPLGIADKLLPEGQTKGGASIVTDVLAIAWLGVALAFTGAAKFTGSLYVREGDRLAIAGYKQLAQVAYLLGGVRPTFWEPTPTPAPVADGAADAGADAEAAADAGAAADAAAAVPAVVDASAPVDAGTPVDAGATGKADKTPAELFRDLSPSVVTIFVKKGEAQGGGTGFLIDEAGVVVTNHHVIEGATSARIKFENGAAYHDIQVLVDNREVDLALLAIDLKQPLEGGAPPDAKPLDLGDSEKIVVGERAIAIGNPLGLEHTLTDGLVSARRLHEGRQWIQISVPISPGNSGGPLFNMRGEVIGINTAQFGGAFAGAQNLNLAVPVNELKRLVKSSYPGRRKLGDPSASSSQW
ncbi:S1C family serine protease [Polyangium mundeleinium]|uniref:Trypsin-like peptidase domain-containing protein n=1 Tax=Polyangium mundeleinium TaxID=2995306 RepID=A0ABT5F570_9BACT|nr:trypsin-like peptidase domain-containing protein [Polyangium mundeleinium]MDC0749237.1 trypsin-like peptidase domain-containing protein [Polyangium mundeleinium]